MAEFTAAGKPTDRLLRLHTPRGADVLLPETFQAIESRQLVLKLRIHEI